MADTFELARGRDAAPRPGLRRRRLFGAGAAMAAMSAMAQTGATRARQRPIRLVVPFPAGGSTDRIGRLLADGMSGALGQQVVVDNRAGANGTLGTEQVAKARADGHTLVLSGIGSNAISYALYRQLGYSDASFRHISLLVTGPQVIVVNNDVPAGNLRELIELARRHPGALSHASAGNGSSGHLTMELIKRAAGVSMVHVPYKGFGAAATDVIGGRVQVLALNNDGAQALLRPGRLKAIAVTSRHRNRAFPTVPTVGESGIVDLDVVSWFGLSAPAGTAQDVVEWLGRGARQALRQRHARSLLQEAGFVVKATGADEFSRFVRDEVARWQAVVQRAGITLD